MATLETTPTSEFSLFLAGTCWPLKCKEILRHIKTNHKKNKPSRGLRHECIAVYFVLKSLLSFFTHAQNAPTQLLLGTDHYFFDGVGGGVGGWG